MPLGNVTRKELFFELNEGQRRTIATTLTILDEALCDFELWAKGREVRSGEIVAIFLEEPFPNL